MYGDRLPQGDQLQAAKRNKEYKGFHFIGFTGSCYLRVFEVKFITLRISIKYFLVAAILQVFIFSASGQNNQNYITLQASSTNFTLNSVAALENPQTITNAFSFNLRSRYSYIIYAKVQNISSSNGVYPPASLLSVQCNYGPAGTDYSKINLSSIDKEIQSGNGFSSSTTFRYDLTLEPFGYNYPAGSYYYTVLLTMTQP